MPPPLPPPSAARSPSATSADSLAPRIEAEREYDRCKARVQEDVRRSLSSAATDTPSHDTLVQDIRRALLHTPAGSKLRGVVASLHAQQTEQEHNETAQARPQLPVLPDDCPYVFAARVEWERRLRVELRALAAKEQRPLVCRNDVYRPQSSAERSIHNAAAGSDSDSDDNSTISADELDEPELQVRCVYTADDLLDVLTAIRNPNRTQPPAVLGSKSAAAESLTPPLWSLLSPSPPAPLLQDLRRQFAFLSPAVRQIGVDDITQGQEAWTAERQRTGEQLLQQADEAGGAAASAAALSALRSFARTGVPPSLRSAVWSRLVGVRLPLLPAQLTRYASLVDRCRRWRLLTDALLRADVSDGAADDEEAFIFSDRVLEISLAFSRDEQLQADSSILISTAVIAAKPSAALRQRVAAENALLGVKAGAAAESTADQDADDFPSGIPPNGVVPFHRQTSMVAPLCFVYSSNADLFFVYRALHCRWLGRLCIVSSAPDTMLPLLSTFTVLLQAHAPAVCVRLRTLRVQPQTYAARWMSTAFAGWLSCRELLLLWDRLWAQQDLSLLPVLAAAMFTWCQRGIIDATSAADVQHALREVRTITVGLVLQQFIFADGETLAARKET